MTERQVTRGGGRLWDPWWIKTAARKQLSVTLKYILEATRDRCWKYVRHGESGGGEKGTGDSEDGAGSDGSGILRQREVTPRWENDPVWLHGGSRQDSGQGRVREPPPEVNKAEGRKW